jgi:hypothetical protein
LKKGTKVADELSEGDLLMEEFELNLSISDGDTMVGMEAGGCGSGLQSIDTEAGQYGILRTCHREMGNVGGDTDKADGEVGGVSTLVPEPVGLLDVIQSEHYRVEGRKRDGCLGGNIEDQQLLGQRDKLFSEGHPREIEGSSLCLLMLSKMTPF